MFQGQYSLFCFDFYFSLLVTREWAYLQCTLIFAYVNSYQFWGCVCSRELGKSSPHFLNSGPKKNGISPILWFYMQGTQITLSQFLRILVLSFRFLLLHRKDFKGTMYFTEITSTFDFFLYWTRGQTPNNYPMTYSISIYKDI